MDTKKTVKITAYTNDRDDPPEGAEYFFSFWREKLDLIPEEHRKTAKIELEAVSSWGEPELKIEITFTRPETDEEQSSRKFRIKEHQTSTERIERAQLEVLQRKYKNA